MSARINEIIDKLEGKYPNPETSLNHRNNFELLIATILSAQTTDVQVNKATEKLFADFKTPEQLASLKPEEVEPYIKSLGLYKNKSKYIVEASNLIVKDFGGKVPDSKEELTRLPGVGRKTANVVLAFGFAEDTFPVDTHVFRVANRLELAQSERVEIVEEQLKSIIPKQYWTRMHHWLIFHGRETCHARNPECNECILRNLCRYSP